MDSISQARLQLIYPPLAAKIAWMIEQLVGEKEYVRVTQAMRTWAEQDALYAQGRTSPGKRVTNCPGGYSYHNYGLAVDLVPSIDGLDASAYLPDWNPSHTTWKRMETLGESQGLDVGAFWRSFPDAPHFQLTGRFPESAPTDEVRQIFKGGGIQAVWDAVTQST